MPGSSLLLDADVTIHIAEIELLESFIKVGNVCMGSIVLRTEVLYYETHSGDDRVPITPTTLIQLGVHELTATTDELKAVRNLFNRVTGPDLHDGELEAIAILLRDPSLTYCTADGAAARAIALLQMSDRVVSLERALAEAGMRRKEIAWQYRDQQLKRHLHEGFLMRSWNIGLR